MINCFRYLALFVLYSIAVSCEQGTTVFRDDDGCTVRLVLQIGVEGTDADVDTIKNALQNCFNISCTIPCPDGDPKNCNIINRVDVVKFSSIPDGDKSKFHKVTMMDDDGQPSNAGIGVANSGNSKSGTWRRGRSADEYCHEVLHFSGLPDQYCDRRRLPDGTISIVRNCTPPPDPGTGGECCVPLVTPGNRCTVPCTGHNADLMATLGVPLSCQNIRDVVALAGFNSCPEKCCTHKPNIFERIVDWVVKFFEGLFDF